jgi:NAD(P)-dependent dehydrogenase (short-subunit alcohol dehydrogenase family)
MTTPPVALVTGASRGLGRALAAGLGARGWALVIDGRDPVTLEQAQRIFPAPVAAIAGDITDSGHRESLLRAARELGQLRLLVNNASTLGATPLPSLAAYPLPELRDVLETNVVASLALAQAALPLLRDSGGAIVNVTSDAGVEAYPGWGGYGLAKAALEQASNVLAVEEPNIRVWWVDPGDLRTSMHQAAFPGEDISDRPLPETVVPAFLRLLDAQLPSGRYRLADLREPVGTVG